MKKYKSSRLEKTQSFKKFSVLLFSFLLVLFSAAAQNKWGIEVKPGVNFATTKLGDADLKTGFGFEGTLSYRFVKHLGVYAGWSWNKFSADQSFAGSKADFEETGYCFGLQFVHPVGSSNINYMLKGGGTYNHIETENSAGNIINDTGHGLGWQAGAGAVIPLGNRFSLTPEVRYRSLARGMTIGEVKKDVNLNYVSVGVGLSFSF